MGRPKEWLPIGGAVLLQRVVRTLHEVVSPVVVAARRGQALPELPGDVMVVHDAVEDYGPLAGIAAGLEALESRNTDCKLRVAMVVSCDHPFLSRAVVEELIESLGVHRAVIVGDGERLYPLLGVYRLDTHAILGELIARGEHRARRFAEECGAEVVSSEALRGIDPQLLCLSNVNEPESYAKAMALAGQPPVAVAPAEGRGGPRG
jgi:molybdopterin-guanine dinucleotide biosynthesis protein A